MTLNATAINAINNILRLKRLIQCVVSVFIHKLKIFSLSLFFSMNWLNRPANTALFWLRFLFECIPANENPYGFNSELGSPNQMVQTEFFIWIVLHIKRNIPKWVIELANKQLITMFEWFEYFMKFNCYTFVYKIVCRSQCSNTLHSAQSNRMKSFF